MDKVTQGNAASAEECASAAEELNAQARKHETGCGRTDRPLVGNTVSKSTGAGGQTMAGKTGGGDPQRPITYGHNDMRPNTISPARELAVSPLASRRGEIFPLNGDFKDFLHRVPGS